MSDELFPVDQVAMDSPKLAWMKKHNIITLHHTPTHCDPTWFAGFQDWWPELTGAAFFCRETAHNGDSRCGEGDTEDDAIVHLLTCWDARRLNIKLWNEETP